MSTPSISPGSKFSLSLSQLIALGLFLIGAAFTIGTIWNGILVDRNKVEETSKKVESIETTLSRVTTILENMEAKQTQGQKQLNDLQDKTNTMNVEIQLMSSSLKEKDLKRKR